MQQEIIDLSRKLYIPPNIDAGSFYAPEDYVAHWRPDMPEEQYHSDKTAFNSSSLKKMLRSPKAFYYDFFLGNKEEASPSMKFGTIAHKVILEGSKFVSRYVVQPDLGDMRSSKNREARDAWRSEQAPDAIIVTQDERDRLFMMIDSILGHSEAFELLKSGVPESTGYWRDPETGLHLRMRCDFISSNLNALVDIKTTRDCQWYEFRRSVEDLRYDFQMMMYDSGIYQITKEKPQHRAWLAIESKAPFEVAVYEVPPEYESTGTFACKRVLRSLNECIKQNVWRQRQFEIEYGEMSPWFFERHEKEGAFDDIKL